MAFVFIGRNTGLILKCDTIGSPNYPLSRRQQIPYNWIHSVTRRIIHKSN